MIATYRDYRALCSGITLMLSVHFKKGRTLINVDAEYNRPLNKSSYPYYTNCIGVIASFHCYRAITVKLSHSKTILYCLSMFPVVYFVVNMNAWSNEPQR